MVVPHIAYPVTVTGTETIQVSPIEVECRHIIQDQNKKTIAVAYDEKMAHYICTRLNAVMSV